MTAATTRAAAALAAAGLAWGATTTPAPAETFRWVNPAGGAWSDRQNWDPVGSPFQEDVVIFDLPEAFAVEISSAQIRRAIFRAGEVRVFRGLSDCCALGATGTDPVYPPGLLIGDRQGGSASLVAELPINAALSMVGFEGAGTLETSDLLLTDELLVGVRAGSTGSVVITGAESHLDGTGYPSMPVDRVTLGVSGRGELTMRDGAVGQVSKLRLASESDGRGELTLNGDGTRLEVDSLEIGEGDAFMTIEAGATLALPEGQTLRLSVAEGRRAGLTLRGGALTGASSLQAGSPHHSTLDGDFLLSLENGSTLSFTEEVVTQSLYLSGSGTALAAPALQAGRDVRLSDGAALRIGPPADAANSHSFNSIGGDVTLDSASLIVEDGAAISRGLTRTGVGSIESAGALMMRGGAVIDAEGGVSVVIIRSSVIDGASSVIQRLQTFQGGVFGDEESTEGYLLLVGIGHPDPPSLTIRGGSIVQASFIKSGVSMFAEGEGTSLAADERMEVASGTLTVRDGAQADSPVIVVRTHGSDGAVLQGDGLLVGSVSNEGVLDPGEQSAPGVLRIEGRVIQRSHSIPQVETVSNSLDSPQQRHLESGELRIDIAGREPGEHDRLEVSGAAILGGTLRATLAEGFDPRWGDRFVFLTAGTIDPGFETLEAPPAPPGLVWEVEFTDTTAALALHRKSDLTRDLSVDAQDLGVLLGEWGLPDSPADLNADGVVDGADLGSLLGQWGLRAN